MMLYAIIQDRSGRISHQPVARALIESDLDASVTKLALRRKCEPLVAFSVYTPTQAAEVIRELEELGDVDVDPRDFEPTWFDPAECLATIASLLDSRARCITPEIRSELTFMARVLSEVARRRARFHFVEVESDAEIVSH